jgi:hypothetical protein
MFFASKIIREGPPPNSFPLASFVSSFHTHSPSSTMICLSEMPIKPSASIYSTFPDLASEITTARLNPSKSRLSLPGPPQQNGCRTFNFNPRMFSQYSLGKTWGRSGCQEREEEHDSTRSSCHRLRPNIRGSIVPISSTAMQNIDV